MLTRALKTVALMLAAVATVEFLIRIAIFAHGIATGKISLWES